MPENTPKRGKYRLRKQPKRAGPNALERQDQVNVYRACKLELLKQATRQNEHKAPGSTA